MTTPIEAFSRRHGTGVVTLLFSDIVGSTQLKQTLGDQQGLALIHAHHALVRGLLAQFVEAQEVSTAGDSFFLVFARPSEAVKFALQLRARLSGQARPAGQRVADRVGIHVGEVFLEAQGQSGRPTDWFGLQVDVGARVMGLAGANQILLTRFAFDNARQVLKGEDLPAVGPLLWASHGFYAIKGVEDPLEVCEVAAADLGAPIAPATSDKAQPYQTTQGELVLGWRPALGQMVGNTEWLLEEKLGEGGFGEVWKARHLRLKDCHVFKFCFRADRVRSLKREVTLFRLLKERIGEHPNIVRLYDTFFDRPPFYLEEEYVAGKDLRSWCEAQGGIEKVPLEVRLEIVAQAADGLQAAHDAGVIHRDVKPGNILISNFRSEIADGVVKLTDFGIGQVVSEEYLAGVTRAGFTQTMLSPGSSQTGTQLYMAPELVSGKPASTRSDIYSLGVVLYQFLVGDFTRPVTMDWAESVSDPLLRDDLKRCFAGQPQDRFAGAVELARQLRRLPQRRAEVEQRQAELARQQAEQAERDRLRRQAAQRQKIVFAATGVAVVLLLVAIALGYMMRKAERAWQLQRRYAYASDMKAAQIALEQNNRGMGMQLLLRYLPKAGEEDLRGIEWRYLWQESRSDDLRSFPHPKEVRDAALSPDGRYLATAEIDSRISVWDAASARLVTNLDGWGSISPKKSLGFTPDGKRLVYRGKSGIDIVDTSKWRAIPDHPFSSTNAPPGLHFGSPLWLSANGQFVAVDDDTGSLEVCDLRRGSRRVLTNELAANYSLAIAPDGALVAYNRAMPVLGGVGPVILWDLQKSPTRNVTNAITADEDTASLTISLDGKWLASGNYSGQVRVWELGTRQRVANFQAHGGLVYGLAFSPDGKLLATGGNDQLIHFWETGTWRNRDTLWGHNSEIWALAFSSDGQTLVSASKDGTAKLWAVQRRHARSYSFTLPTNAIAVSSLPDGSALVTVDAEQRTTRFWSLPEGQLIRSKAWTEIEQQGCQEARFFPGCQVVVGVSTNGTVHFWDLITGAHLRSVQLGGGSFRPGYLSPDQRWLLGILPDENGILCDLRAARWGRPFPFAGSYTHAAAFSADSRWLAYSTLGGAIKLRDLAADREKAALEGHSLIASALRFSPDGKLLASGGTEGDIRLWKVDAGKPLFDAPLKGHRSGVIHVAFSPDGRTLATTCGADQTIRLWSLATGQDMLLLRDVTVTSANLSSFTDPCYSSQAEWNPAGKWLVWQERKGAIRVTPLPTLREIDAIEQGQVTKR